MLLKKYLFLLCMVLIVIPGISQNPNILLVIADDLGRGSIPNYQPNTTKANMPNLEAMMQNGIRFENVWSNPVCSPSRANLLTGRYGFRTNVLNPTELSTLSLDETSLHAYINQSSSGLYSNSLIGKWHLGGGGGMNGNLDYPLDLGIDYFAGIIAGGVADYSEWRLLEDGQFVNTTEYITSKFTDLAIDWINAQDQPWFCWLAYTAPHTPFHLPPDFMHTQGELPTDDMSIDENPLPYYLAMVESVDYEIGRLMQSISKEEWDNTIIIFIGDNGTPNQVVEQPYRRGKGSLFQGGVNVPMVISGKGVDRTNDVEDALISFSDMFATIVELTGTPLSQYEDSKSFASLLKSASSEAIRECAYTEVQDDDATTGWAARDETYKYLLFNGNERFYNLIDDPYESNNLLPNLNNAEQVAFDKLSNKFNVISSVNENQEFDFELYPNPVKDVLTVNSVKTANYKIYDMAGVLQFKGSLQSGSNKVKVQDLREGTYFLQIGNTQKKFIRIRS